MALRLPEVERAYYVRKLGVQAAGTKPLNQIKREYWAQVIGSGAATTPFNELQIKWIMKVIANAGATPASNYETDLWRQMVALIGGTPVRNITQNQIIFFSTAP